MRYAPYPSYRRSGVDWLGDVPKHWEVKRLRRLVRLRNQKVEATEESRLPYVGLEHLESWTGRLLPLDQELTPTGIAGHFHSGSILFGKLRPYLAKAYIATFHGLCSTELLVLEAPTQARRFLLYQLLSNAFISIVDASTYGAKMPRASWEFIGNCELPVPPSEEQCAIAAFLDRATASIDELIAKKQRMVETLKEKRSALISRTVSRGLPPYAARAAGLDPHPPLKSTGIEWLGDVPGHWNAVKIKHVAKIESGHTPSRSADDYWIDCTIPWVSLNDSKSLRENDYISDTVYRINALGLANSSARILPARSVVFSRDATVGLCAISTKAMAVSQHFVAYLCGPELFPEYLLACLKAMNQHLTSLSLGATISTIGMDDIRSLKLALPPLREQEAIVKYITRETMRMDRMILKVEEAIERLREYRSALITAAVTGKIDVRSAA